MTTAAAASVPLAARWGGLDALRGLSIAAMILVNNPGDWGHMWAQLRHADWHGCTCTDLVFPTFLFVSGAAIVPALNLALQRGRSTQELFRRVVRRAALLVLWGLLLHSFPWITFAADGSLLDPLLKVRVPGVLQRIGVCYLGAALLFLCTSERVQRIALVACLAAYWPLLALCPTPDGGAPDLATHGDHLAGWLDRTVFGPHVYRRGLFDPEGLLSTIPALATTLLGVQCGRVLASSRAVVDKVRALLGRGALWTVVGLVWSLWFPLNKALWTSSYALFTAGIAALLLGVFSWLFERPRAARCLHPLLVYGRNALLVFVGSGILARVVGRLITVGEGEATVSLQRWVYVRTFAAVFEPYLASCLWAVLWMAAWYCVLAWLWRRDIVWRL